MIIRDCFYIVDEEDFNENFVKTVRRYKYPKEWEAITYTYKGIPLYLNTDPTQLQFPVYLEKTWEGWDYTAFYQCGKEKVLEYWNKLLIEIQEEIKKIEKWG